MQARYTRSDRLFIDMARIMRIVARRLFASGIGTYFTLSVRIGFGYRSQRLEAGATAVPLCRLSVHALSDAKIGFFRIYLRSRPYFFLRPECRDTKNRRSVRSGGFPNKSGRSVFAVDQFDALPGGCPAQDGPAEEVQLLAGRVVQP